jgi:hypothetical protein
MCVGTDFCLIGLGTIRDPARRAEIAERLAGTGRTVIDLSHEQIGEFAGNAIELQARGGRTVVMSARALKALQPQQVATLERFATILPLEVPTIELAGGSVRCMLAGIHLAARNLALPDRVAAIACTVLDRDHRRGREYRPHASQDRGDRVPESAPSHFAHVRCSCAPSEPGEGVAGA